MNVGTITCLVLAVIFLFMAIIFSVLKDKAAMLISGFNTLPKEEREHFDKGKMSVDQRNRFFLWAIIFIAGALLSYLASPYAAIIAFAIWLILFFKEVHFDTNKAFEKYKNE